MRTSHLAHQVTYCRSGDLVEVAATVGKTTFEIDSGYGAIEKFESRDFLISTDVLILGGEIILPQSGDRIKETIGQQIIVYEVMAPAKEPCWRYSDPYRITLRIHSKQIAVE